jgi:hypothetical protein
MPTRKAARVIRVHHEGPRRFVTRNENPTDSPLGVDRTIYGAVGTAQREATLASRKGYRIFIEVEQPDGKWKREAVIDPP